MVLGKYRRSCCAVMVGLATLVPTPIIAQESNSGANARPVTEQASEQSVTWVRPTGPAPYWMSSSVDRLARQNQTRKKLETRVSIEWHAHPLRQAIAELGTQAGVSFTIDEIELDNIGVAADAPITISGKNVVLREALDRMLTAYDLGVIVGESGFEITSSDRVNAEASIRVYDLAYISSKSLDMQRVSRLIQSMVDPEEWREMGVGNSDIVPFGSALIVAASESTHRKIETLLSRISRMPENNLISTQQVDAVNYVSGILLASQPQVIQLANSTSPSLYSDNAHAVSTIKLPEGKQFQLIRLPAKSKNPASTDAAHADATESSDQPLKNWARPKGALPAWVEQSDTDRVATIKTKLERKAQCDFLGVPLKVALNELLKDLDVPVWICEEELDNIGVDSDQPVTMTIEDTSLASILKRILDPLNLAYRVNSSNIQVTSRDDVNADPVNATYELAYLSTKALDMNVVVQAVTRTVAPDEWCDFGGVGSSMILPLGSQLHVSAPESVHLQIEELLYQVSQIHPDNLPLFDPQKDGRPQVVVNRIPGGSTVLLPTDGRYEIREVSDK